MLSTPASGETLIPLGLPFLTHWVFSVVKSRLRDPQPTPIAKVDDTQGTNAFVRKGIIYKADSGMPLPD
jgi:hypothetical protein